MKAYQQIRNGLQLWIRAMPTIPQYYWHSETTSKCPQPDIYLWSPYVVGQTIIFSSCFFLLSSSFFSSPNLSGPRFDVYHTLAHGGGLSANLECRSEMHCTRLAANTGRKKSPSRHHRTTLSGHIFTNKACIDNRKKNLLSSNTSSTCPDNMVNFSPLTAEIGSGVWCTPTNFNGFCVLAALLHGI